MTKRFRTKLMMSCAGLVLLTLVFLALAGYAVIAGRLPARGGAIVYAESPVFFVIATGINAAIGAFGLWWSIRLIRLSYVLSRPPSSADRARYEADFQAFVASDDTAVSDTLRYEQQPELYIDRLRPEVIDRVEHYAKLFPKPVRLSAMDGHTSDVFIEYQHRDRLHREVTATVRSLHTRYGHNRDAGRPLMRTDASSVTLAQSTLEQAGPLRPVLEAEELALIDQLAEELAAAEALLAAHSPTLVFEPYAADEATSPRTEQPWSERLRQRDARYWSKHPRPQELAAESPYWGELIAPYRQAYDVHDAMRQAVMELNRFDAFAEADADLALRTNDLSKRLACVAAYAEHLDAEERALYDQMIAFAAEVAGTDKA